SFWEPLAAFLESNVSASLTYFWDFVSLWLLFCVFLVIFRTVTGFASRVKVKFMGIVDRSGGAFLAACIGWVMVCFTLMTLHTAPLARNFLFGAFRPHDNMFLGMAPDRQWLSFVVMQSKGSFSRMQPRVFDPERKFIHNYENRRATLEEHLKTASGPRGILVSGGPKRISGAAAPAAEAPPGEAEPAPPE
ncbi:MAG: hypothetical protein ABIK89_10195, partial [Planctomycetota bacterium]